MIGPSFFIGLLFGLGLLLSGMSNPAKVIAFLDVTGNWKPDLLWVMGGAVLVAILPFQWQLRRQRALAVEAETTGPGIDQPLVLGSALFGIGWGLSGLCPGPAVLGAGAGYFPSVIFVAAMLVGMRLFTSFNARSSVWR